MSRNSQLIMCEQTDLFELRSIQVTPRVCFVDENDEVLVAGFGRSGHAVGDLPGVRFKIVKVAGAGLFALWARKKDKPIS